MQNKAFVSVIIPVYNAEKYILTTIASVLNQTYEFLEIIVVNDGSTDQTLALLNSIKDSRLKVISQTSKGASYAKQIGLTYASGEYIQYLDADDLLSKDKIGEQVALLNRHKNYVSICETIHFLDGTNHFSYPRIEEWYATEQNKPADFLIKLYGGSLIGPKYGGMIQPNAFLTPIAVAKAAGDWNISISPCPDEDGEYFCRIILAAEGIIYAPKGINYYRKFPNKKSLSAVTDRQACENVLNSTKLRSHHLLKATNNPKARMAMSSNFWYDAFSFFPQHKELSKEAADMAEKLDSTLTLNPFKSTTKKIIFKIFGWKTVKYIAYYKAKLSK